MKTFTVSELTAALEKTGIAPGMTVFMHSSLFALGRLQGASSAESLRLIIQAIRDVLGPEGTLAVPTFNFSCFSEGKPYDRQKTPSKDMGVLSEFVRALPDACRNYHPIQSIAAVGKHAAAICAVDAPSGYDEAGSFGVMLRLDARVLLLGLDCNWISFIHYVEEQAAVPYRYWKTFTGAYTDGQTTREASYTMFVRRRDIDPVLDLNVVQKSMSAKQLLKRATLGSGEVMACGFRELFQDTSEQLAKDPYWLVANKADFSA